MLSLPDDILGLIVLETLRGSVIRPNRYWCRIATTCRRLWNLHLPPTLHTISICHENNRPLEVDGIQWYLRRLKSAKSLAIGVGGNEWSTDDFANFMESCLVGQLKTFQALQVLVRAAEPASVRSICYMMKRHLALPKGMHFPNSNQEIYLRPRSLDLVQGAPNLAALTLHLCTMQTIDRLSSSSLKYLALHISLEGAWPKKFPDFKGCISLENLKVVMKTANGSICDLASGKHPDICLSHMPNLRHFELEEQALPRDKLALPSGCQLFTKLCGYQTDLFGEDCLENVPHHATVMCLNIIALHAWPAALGSSGLQLLVLEFIANNMMNIPLLDLAVLRYIPHVRLYSRSFLDLSLTEGSWQSLDIHSDQGLYVEFLDMDAFVTSTKLFSFCYGYMDAHDWKKRRMCATMVDNIHATCGKHEVECYKTSHSFSSFGMLKRVTKISNKKLKPPFDTQEALQARKPTIWQLKEVNTLAPYEDFWPQDPCKSLSGTHK